MLKVERVYIPEDSRVVAYNVEGDIAAPLYDVLVEIENATSKHGKFNSAHEGYAVLLEEVDELWDEVRKRNHDKHLMRKEAVQVAAMALRFIMDVTE